MTRYIRKKIVLEIPDTYDNREVVHLSDFPIFDDLLDQGKVIVDKQIPGCGATEYYLRCNKPVILTAPLNMLFESKMDANPTDEELLLGNFDRSIKRANKVHCFDRSNLGLPIEKTRELLYEYLQNDMRLPNFTPKIMVSYDSFGAVCDMLEYMGTLSDYTIVVDEFPSIFQYVELPGKGYKFLNFMARLERLNNHIVFLTATPVKDKYIDPIPVFDGVPYYTLKWNPEKIQKVRIMYNPISSIKNKMLEIVSNFRISGNFRSTLDANGQLVESKEGVFYLNNVREIVNIINACRLKSDEVMIICSRNSDNERKLKKIDPALGTFSISKPSGVGDYKNNNKPFTFITSVAFLGVDMYSDSSSAYVFANGNVASLSLDISIDLPQIAGRCRNEQIFKDDIELFYVASDMEVIEKAKREVEAKVEMTNKMLPFYSNMNDLTALRPIVDAQKSGCYKNYYLDVKDLGNGLGEVVINQAAYQADLRAIDIKEEQYRSGYDLCRFVNKTAQNTLTSQMYNVVYAFFVQYRSLNDFVSRMKLYVDTMQLYPSVKSYIEQHLTSVDIEYKQFYNLLGPDEIRRCGYRRKDILMRIDSLKHVNNQYAAIVSRCYTLMPKGSKHSKKDVKQYLSQVYTEFCINRVAKSTDLQEWGISTKDIKISQGDKRVDGYEIL